MGINYITSYKCPLFSGIFAILKSTECRDAIARGDAQMAAVKSQEAKRFANITLGVGLGAVALSIAIVVIYVVIIVSANT